MGWVGVCLHYARTVCSGLNREQEATVENVLEKGAAHALATGKEGKRSGLVIPGPVAGGKCQSTKHFTGEPTRLTRRRTEKAPEALRTNWLALANDSPNAGMEPKPREDPANLKSGLRGKPGAGQPAWPDAAGISLKTSSSLSH